MNLKQARQAVADIKAKGAALLGTIRAREGGKPTAEESTQLAAIEQDLTAAEAVVTECERLADLERRMGTGVSGSVLNVGRNLEADRPWASLGEQLCAIARASMPNPTIDPRLQAAASGASAGEPSTGGFLMHTAYSDALLERAREESPIVGQCNQIPIPEGTESLDLPVIDETSRGTGSRFGGVRVYRKAEADTVTASKPKFGALKIQTSEIMGIAYATDRLLRNSRTIEAVFGNAFASEFAFKVTDELFRGGGGDECVGILNAAATVSQAKETGQAAASIVMENLSNMWSRVHSRSKSRGEWYINNDAEPALDKVYKSIGTGGSEVPFITYQNGQMFIKGRPVRQLEQCATLGTVGDIVFADWSQYILSPQGAIEGSSSMHVRFIYGEMTFRWVYYINGRPAWLSALTPYKGASTLSPFVTLATRA